MTDKIKDIAPPPVNTPSVTAIQLTEALSEPSRVLEIGFRDGHDLYEIARLGHEVVGIGPDTKSFVETAHFLEKFVSTGQIHLMLGDFDHAPLTHGQFDAILSHRFLHQIHDPESIREFVNFAAKMLRPDGKICVSAQDRRAFDAEKMTWLDSDRCDAEYTQKEREGQRVSIWTERRFKEAFCEHFDVRWVTEASAYENRANPEELMTYSLMYARKKGGA